MTTEAQVEANRTNAQKSTGPRTAEGKAVVAQNALKHGLFAKETVIRGEDEHEFEIYREDLLQQLIPRSPVEEMLADRVVDLSWRLKRAVKDQSDTFAALYEKYIARLATPEVEADSAGGTGLGVAGVPPARGEGVSPSHRGPEALGTRGQACPEPGGREARAPAGAIGRMILEDFSGEAVLDRLLRYERRIEGSLYRTLREMRGVFDQRKKALEETRNTLERWQEEDWEAKKARAFARCAAPAVPAGPPASNFPPQTFGGTPAAQGQTCKTTPILAGAAASADLCGTKPILGGAECQQGGYLPIFPQRR